MSEATAGALAPFAVANAAGLRAFATAGAPRAADADLDLPGVVVLGAPVASLTLP